MQAPNVDASPGVHRAEKALARDGSKKPSEFVLPPRTASKASMSDPCHESCRSRPTVKEWHARQGPAHAPDGRAERRMQAPNVDASPGVHRAEKALARDGSRKPTEFVSRVLPLKAYSKGMARPAGLEPATPRFEAWCSIQLNYGRVDAETGADVA